MDVIESYNPQSSSVRSQKSRITSLSTFLGESQKVHSDKLGIRKFAKTCSRPFSTWSYPTDDNQSSINVSDKLKNHNSDVKFQTQTIDESKSVTNDDSLPDIVGKMDTFSLRNMTKRCMKKNQSDPNVPASQLTNWKNNFDDQSTEDPRYSIQLETQLQILQQYQFPAQPQKLPLQLTRLQSHQNIPGERKPHLQNNSNVANISNRHERDLIGQLELSTIDGIGQVDIKFENFNNSGLEFGRRVVRFENFPSNVGIKAVISQICGGPLEKIEIIGKSSVTCSPDMESGKYPLRNCYLDIWFLNPCDAKRFMDFTRTGLFLVNGHNFQPDWAPSHNQNNQKIDYSDMNSIKYSHPFHEAASKNIADQMMMNQARRCIIMKKLIQKNRNKSPFKHYPAPLENWSILNVVEIKEDFVQFGTILEVYPVVSKKLCFIVHFFEAQSAIDSKRCFDDELSNFHNKYKDWTIWYGVDPSEKPCVDT